MELLPKKNQQIHSTTFYSISTNYSLHYQECHTFSNGNKSVVAADIDDASARAPSGAS